ncbi:ATP-dependent RNA helicase DDX24-like [Asterias rubens]|uniref:ATP-dependent RNA helicase DDX24-like n=1 Tax=Asterias rubens TaxID=7604 RepID=UPI001455C526|nr:ATP-dependent RNA helicase DDX24-like [Asterias rubens]
MEVDTSEESTMPMDGNWTVADVDYGALKLDELGHFLGIEELQMDEEIIIGRPSGARNKPRRTARRRRNQRKLSSLYLQNSLKRKDPPLEDDQAIDEKRQKINPTSKSNILTFNTEKKKTPKDSKKIKEKRDTKQSKQNKEDGDKPEKDDDKVAASSKMRKDVAGAKKSKKTSTSFTKGIPVVSNQNSNMSMSAWKNLQIPAPVLQALRDLGFQEPTPIQKATISVAIQDKKDIIGAAETGSGKTLAFGIPVIHRILQHKATIEREARANAYKEANMETVTKTKQANLPKGMKVKDLTSQVPKSAKASKKLSVNPPAGQNRNVKRSGKMESKDEEEGEVMFREQESDEEEEEEEDLETGDFDFDEEDDEEDEDIEYDFDDEDDSDEEEGEDEDLELEDNGDESEDDGDDLDDLDEDDDEIDYDSDESDSDGADNEDDSDGDDSSDEDDSDHDDNQNEASKKPHDKDEEKTPTETDQPGEPQKKPKGKKGKLKRRFRIKERKVLELDGAEFEGIELINKMKKRGIGCVRAIDDISEEEMLSQLGSNKTVKTVKPNRIASFDDDRQLYALIMTPTRELAVQIKNHLVNITKYTDLKIAVIVGGMSAQKQQRMLKKRPEIVVGTPGRIWELFREGEPHLSTMSGVQSLVLDEADRMIEKGHYEEVTQIIQQLNYSRASLERQTFVFSATLTLLHLGPDRKIAGSQPNKQNNPKQDKKDRKAKLNALIKRVGIREDPAIVDLTKREGTVASLMEAKIISDITDKDIYLFYFLVQFPGRTLVFTNSIDCIRRLCSILTLLSCNPLPLHSSMHQKQRLKNLDRFASNPKALLLATDVAARGLDIPDVQHVIHYQMPRTSETYIHRSGRTARQAKEGISVMLVAPTEANFYRRVCKTLNRDDIPSFPVDHSYYNAVKQRVDLARLIDQESHSVAKKKHTNDWFIKAAKELDVDLDEDLVLHDLGDSQEQMHREKKLQHMKGDLKRLLQRDIFPRGSSWRYPTAPGKLISSLDQGPSNALAMVKNKPGNKFKLDSKEATGQPKKGKKCRNKFKRAEAEKAP